MMTKKQKQKLFLILLAAALSAMALSGCDSRKEPETLQTVASSDLEELAETTTEEPATEETAAKETTAEPETFQFATPDYEVSVNDFYIAKTKKDVPVCVLELAVNNRTDRIIGLQEVLGHTTVTKGRKELKPAEIGKGENFYIAPEGISPDSAGILQMAFSLKGQTRDGKIHVSVMSPKGENGSKEVLDETYDVKSAKGSKALPKKKKREEATTAKQEETAAAAQDTAVQETQHVHNYYIAYSVPASCTSQGYNVYQCSCGASYTGDYSGPYGHNYQATLNMKNNTTTYTCTNCGDSYVVVN